MTFRLTALYVGIALLAGALIFITIYYQTNAILARQITQTVNAEADDLRTAARFGGPVLLARLIEARGQSGGERLYLLIDEQGRRVAGNIAAWPPAIHPDQAGGTFRYSPLQPVSANANALGAGAAIALGGGYALLVGRDIEEQRRLGARLARPFLFGFAALSLAGLLGGLWASRFVLSRIGAISATTRSIMAGSFSNRVPVSGSGDELDALAGDLNQMLARIEQLMAALKEVSDNIAHDLKTPLNRLRNHAEEALRTSPTEARYREALEQITDEADELITTFNALLLIAKLEAGTSDDSTERLDAVELVSDIVDLYQPAADEAGRHLTFASPPSSQLTRTLITANRHLIGQAVANMIDNALKYGNPAPHQNGDIHVQVRPEAGNVEITVADRGPGIPEHERKRVLERFVRLEASRSRPGTGLGLSLVAAVARLSAGEVRLEDNAPGLRITLILPASRP